MILAAHCAARCWADFSANLAKNLRKYVYYVQL
jgi:hypothetical protein